MPKHKFCVADCLLCLVLYPVQYSFGCKAFQRLRDDWSVSKETVQLSVAQQIWVILQELVAAIARVFGLLDEEIYDAVINQSDELAHIANFFNKKSAS